MKVVFENLTWFEVKESMKIIEKKVKDLKEEFDYNYDIVFLINGIKYIFIFQHNELEEISVYKEGE